MSDLGCDWPNLFALHACCEQPRQSQTAHPPPQHLHAVLTTTVEALSSMPEANAPTEN
jgi:hypothetical protein